MFEGYEVKNEAGEVVSFEETLEDAIEVLDSMQANDEHGTIEEV